MNNIKKLAFITNIFRETAFTSGGEKLFYEIIKRAVKDGFSVDLFCTRYAGDKTLEGDFNVIYLQNKVKDFKRPEKLKRIYKNIENEIKNKNYDFVISNNITPPLGLAFMQGHSERHYLKMSHNPFTKILYWLKKHKLMDFQQNCFKKGYKQIFVPSNILKEDLIANFKAPKELINVIYPGTNLPEREPVVKFNEIIENKRDIVFGISAPNFSNKGGYLLIESLGLLKRQKINNFKIKIIYGRANKNLFLKFLIKFYNLKENIEFIPFQKDMENFYNSIDCLIMPSKLETFGLVTIEAMSYRKPCIVSSVSGVSEIIKDEENGIVFDFMINPSLNLSTKLIKIIENPDLLYLMSDKAYETAKNATWEKAYCAFISHLS